MRFNHKMLDLPIHPGDTVYTINEFCGWNVEPMPVDMVCITEDDIYIKWRQTDLEMSAHFEDDWFTDVNKAQEWADAHRPDPPYPYCGDTFKWMDTRIWLPCNFQWCYIRIGRYISRAFYNNRRFPNGFYDSDGESGRLIEGVDAWMDGVCTLNEVLHAGDYTLRTD